MDMERRQPSPIDPIPAPPTSPPPAYPRQALQVLCHTTLPSSHTTNRNLTQTPIDASPSSNYAIKPPTPQTAHLSSFPSLDQTAPFYNNRRRRMQRRSHHYPSNPPLAASARLQLFRRATRYATASTPHIQQRIDREGNVID
jgi:hypothetical protein